MADGAKLCSADEKGKKSGGKSHPRWRNYDDDEEATRIEQLTFL